MKDKKFIVMCTLFAVWIALFLGMVTGGFRVNPKVEYLITFLCIGWFAFWTLSSLKEWNNSQDMTDPTSKQTENPNKNGRTKKTSKEV